MARVKMIVEVNTDPVPGTFHDEEDVVVRVQQILDEAIGHYKPKATILVTMQSVFDQPDVVMTEPPD